MNEKIFYNALNIVTESNYAKLSSLLKKYQSWEKAWQKTNTLFESKINPSEEWGRLEKSIDTLAPPKDQLLFGLSSWMDSQERLYGVSASLNFEGREVEATEDTLGRVGFLMSITGPLEGALTFLKEIETRSPRFLMSLDSVDIVKADESYKLSVSGYAFFK